MAKITKTEIVRIESRCSALVETAELLTVENSNDETKAYGILKNIKSQLSAIEVKRKVITGPLNQSLHNTNDMFRRLSAPLVIADSILRNRIIEFRKKEEEKVAKEQVKREKIQEAHRQQGHQTHELVPITADTGDATVQKRWTYEVIDLSKVPHKFLQIDAVQVRIAIDDGIRDIPGLRIYQEMSVSVR